MQSTQPVALIVDCPVDSLFSGPGLVVLELYGTAREELLHTLLLSCVDVNVSVLNRRFSAIVF